MEPTVFRHVHRVTYAECTVGNHVYYARYLDLLEAARGEFFRHVGLTLRELQEQGFIFPVTEATLRYRGAARYDDSIVILMQVSELGRVRVAFEAEIRGPDGRLLLTATTRHACTGLDDRPRRLPEALVERLGPFHRPPVPASSSPVPGG